MSIASDILATPDLEFRRPIKVPQWPTTDGKLFIRHMSGAEHDRYIVALRKHLDGHSVNHKAVAVVSVLVDSDGKRIFADAQAEDVAKKNVAALDYIFDQWANLSDESPSVEDQKKV